MKWTIGLAVVCTCFCSAVFAKDPPFKRGQQVFLTADELSVAEDENYPPDRLTRGDTLKFLERKDDEALVGFAGDSQYKSMFGVKTLVEDGKPVTRQTWVPIAKLARTHEEAIAPPDEKPESVPKLTAEQWRTQLRGTWRDWGWEQYGRRHRFADPKPLRTKEGALLPNPQGIYFWEFHDKGAKHFTREKEPHITQDYTELWIDASDSPAIIDLIFVVEMKHVYSHKYAVEMEGEMLRLAWLGATLGKDTAELKKKVKKIPNPKRTWTVPGEIMLVDLLVREKTEKAD